MRFPNQPTLPKLMHVAMPTGLWSSKRTKQPSGSRDFMNWKSSGAMFQSIVLAKVVAKEKSSGRIDLILNITVKV
jgi:hypothetical protein